MAETTAKQNPTSDTNKTFFIGLARAFAGAILFSFPIIMTMEMWSLGVSIDSFRLALFMFLALPLLVGLSYFIGFEHTTCLKDDVIDAFVAYAVGFLTSAALLILLGIIDFSESLEEAIGKISIQAVVAAIGAMLAQSQLGAHDADSESNGDEENTENKEDTEAQENEEDENEEPQRRNSSYGGELFLMGVGAIFLAMNPAPTEEIVLISYKMTNIHFIILAVFTILLMHAFVYKVEFRGNEGRNIEESSALSVFLRYTIVGYALVSLISLYLIWTFGHTEGMDLSSIIKTVVVMSFPGALGAAASRLIL